MASFSDSHCHAADGQVGAGQPDEDKVKLIAARAQALNPRSEGAACQSCLKCETRPAAASSFSRVSMTLPA